MDLITNYSMSEIAIFCVILAAAIKGIVGFIDWAWGRIRKVTDADYKTKEERKALEKKTNDAEAFMTTEHDRLDEKMAELDNADRQIRDEMERTDRQILSELAAIREALDERTKIDDARHADTMREYILRFNMELVRDVKHTREDFVEVLAKMDDYDKYCRSHPDYKNHRAKAAIDNISRVYQDRLAKNDFA